MVRMRIACLMILCLGVGCAQDKIAYYSAYFEDARILSTESREQADQMNVAESDIPIFVYAMVRCDTEDGILLLLAQKDRLSRAIRKELYREALRRRSVPLVDAMALSVPCEERRDWIYDLSAFLERDQLSAQFSTCIAMAGTYYEGEEDVERRVLPVIASEILMSLDTFEFYEELPTKVVWEAGESQGNYVFGEGKVKNSRGEWGYGSTAALVVGAYKMLIPFFKEYFSVDYAPEAHTIRTVIDNTLLPEDIDLAPFFTIQKKGNVYSVLPGQTQEDRWYTLAPYVPHGQVDPPTTK